MTTTIHYLSSEILFSRRAHKRHLARTAKAFSAISLGAAFAFTVSEAAAQSARASSDDAFTAIDGTPLGFNEDGDLRVMLASGEEMTIPRGEYGLVGDQIMVSDLIDGVEVAQNGYIPPTSGAYPTYSSPGFFGGMGYGGILIPVGLVAVGILAYIVLTRSANTAPEFSAASYSTSVAENTAATTNVLSVAATDKEKDTITYTLSGADSEHFSIDASGNIKFLVSPNYDAEGDAGRDHVYNFNVTATDDHGKASSSPVTVTVTDASDSNTADAAATPTSFTTGNDDVTLSSAALTGFNANSGNDYVVISATGAMDQAGRTAEMGAGNDLLDIGNDLGFATFVNLGAGNDEVILSADDQSGVLTINLGTGEDIVEIDVLQTQTHVIQNFSSDDIIDLTGVSGISTFNATASSTVVANGVNYTVAGTVITLNIENSGDTTADMVLTINGVSSLAADDVLV